MREDAPEAFAAGVAVDVHPVVTIAELNHQAIRLWLTRGHLAQFIHGLDNMLAGHVLAYDAIHRRQPAAHVTTTNRPVVIYELDQMLTDVLLARHHRVHKDDLRDWLVERRRQHYHRQPPPKLHERALRAAAASAMPLEMALPRAISAVYD
ncbi:MAG: hypothetical protein ACRDUA_26580, partial [Micromonosporaceae bacterium]